MISKKMGIPLIVGVAIIVLMCLAAFGLVGYRWVSGKSFGLKSGVNSILFPVKNPIAVILGSRAVKADSRGDFTNVIFLHHSVGHNLIAQGNLRELFQQNSFALWDQDYIGEGLTAPDGSRTGYSYPIPSDNTDPDGLAVLFDQPLYGVPVNALSGLMEHEVIMLKSCFPNSQITSNEQLQKFKDYYISVRAFMQKHPEKLFIILTQPPLNPAETNLENAARARQLADWMKSEDFIQGTPNLAVFDFFDLLAEDDGTSSEFNMLRAAYRTANDSHPNQAANETIAPLLSDFVKTMAEQYRAATVNTP
jgi:hypothetical protein